VRPAPAAARYRGEAGVTALAELLRDGQAEALARLRLDLAAGPPPPAEPVSAVCGRPRPVPAAVFRPAAESS
jgi:hypothetical protein